MKGINKYKICPRCRQFREPYIKSNDYCQRCYREILDEYSLYDYKVEKEKIKNETVRKILRLLIEEGVERQEIYKILGLNKVYVGQIINKYTIRVNTNGEKRPF